MEPWLIIILILGALFALVVVVWFVVWLCVVAFAGAAWMFAYYDKQGLFWLAVYIACWALFFPVMLVISIVSGLIVRVPIGNNNSDKDSAHSKRGG